MSQKRRRNSIVPTEDQEQILLFDWASHIPILRDYMIHIPNGGSRNILEGIKFKKMGVKAGVSDVLLAYPSKGYAGYWGELKRRDRKLSIVSHKQSEWLCKMKQVGYMTGVWYGWDEARQELLSYLSGNK